LACLQHTREKLTASGKKVLINHGQDLTKTAERNAESLVHSALQRFSGSPGSRARVPEGNK
jgi:hypothetical protein